MSPTLCCGPRADTAAVPLRVPVAGSASKAHAMPEGNRPLSPGHMKAAPAGSRFHEARFALLRRSVGSPARAPESARESVQQGTAQPERSKVSASRETPGPAVKDSREIIPLFV